VKPEQIISSTEMERVMKRQGVILRVMAGGLKWWEAAEIIGVSDRTVRRWRERYE
jgi:transposase